MFTFHSIKEKRVRRKKNTSVNPMYHDTRDVMSMLYMVEKKKKWVVSQQSPVEV